MAVVLVLAGWLIGLAIARVLSSWDGLTPRQRRELQARWSANVSAASRRWE